LPRAAQWALWSVSFNLGDGWDMSLPDWGKTARKVAAAE